MFIYYVNFETGMADRLSRRVLEAEGIAFDGRNRPLRAIEYLFALRVRAIAAESER